MQLGVYNLMIISGKKNICFAVNRFRISAICFSMTD